MKVCKSCNEYKSILDFNFNKQQKDGHSCYCRNCDNKRAKKYYENNKLKVLKRTTNYCKSHPEISKKSNKNWYDKNKEFKNKRYKEWYAKNKKRKIEYNIKWIKNKRHNDFYYKIIDKNRNRINSILNNKRISGIKTLLGCNKKQFIEYIESKFFNGMNWKNHGLYGWHIDHIKSIKSFKFDEIKTKKDLNKKIKQCFHYTNLQPLWAIDNLKKGAA